MSQTFFPEATSTGSLLDFPTGTTKKHAPIRFFPPMDLDAFYAAPFDKEKGRKVIEDLGKLILDPA